VNAVVFDTALAAYIAPAGEEGPAR